jgi:Zn-dependent oligopeptidase
VGRMLEILTQMRANPSHNNKVFHKMNNKKTSKMRPLKNKLNLARPIYLNYKQLAKTVVNKCRQLVMKTKLEMKIDRASKLIRTEMNRDKKIKILRINFVISSIVFHPLVQALLTALIDVRHQWNLMTTVTI